MLPPGMTAPAGGPGGPAPKDPEPIGRFEGKKATRCITAYSKYSVDFILWRIWKMQLFPLFKCSRYVDWTRYPQKMPKSHTNADGKSDGSGMVYIWGKDVVYPADQPQPPVPYSRQAQHHRAGRLRKLYLAGICTGLSAYRCRLAHPVAEGSHLL